MATINKRRCSSMEYQVCCRLMEGGPEEMARAFASDGCPMSIPEKFKGAPSWP